MEEEKEDGNKEYKLKVSPESAFRLEQLTSQMRYRVEEGHGEAIYHLGVDDGGTLIGMTDDEYKHSHENLLKIAEKNNYAVSLLSEKSVDNNRKVYELLIREINNIDCIEIKVAIAGNVDSGK